MPDSFPGLSRISQVLIPVRDASRSLAFYRDVLGLRFLFAYPRMAFVDAAGTRLMLGDAEREEFRGRVTLYFDVDDIDSAYRELSARGAPFEDGPHVVHRDESVELWMAFLHDPDGHNLAISEERRPDRA